MKKFLKKAEGFTLVELIVVIAILGILAGIAIPAYTGYMDKAKEAGDNQILSAVKTAADAAMATQPVAYDSLKVAFVTTGEGASAKTVTSVTAYYPDDTFGTDTGSDADEVLLYSSDTTATVADTDFDTYFGGNKIEFKSKDYKAKGATWTSAGWAPTT